MIDENSRWGIGLLVTLFIALGGWLITAFRNVSKKIADLHGRVDQVKDDISDNYVKQEALDRQLKAFGELMAANLKPLHDEVAGLRSDMRETNEKMLTAIRHPPP